MKEDSERVEYLLNYWSHRQLAREYEILENKIQDVIDYIEKNSGMISRFSGIKFNYPQEELSIDQLDNLLNLLKGE